jgi:hypothetical protein
MILAHFIKRELETILYVLVVPRPLLTLGLFTLPPFPLLPPEQS